MEQVRGASTEAIRFHYDLSNEFYRLWLDDLMVYSCALWSSDAAESLQTAQIRKLDWHLEQAGVVRGSSLLDVGCGWGALLHRAHAKYDVKRVVGLTLSARQAEHIAAASSADVCIEVTPWQNHRAEQPYDAIISIGAFEHFADLNQTEAEKVEGYRTFFAFCHRSLTPGGSLSLQTITYGKADRQSFSEFFAEHVFPESDLPHLSEIVKAAEGLFEITRLRNDRQHYVRTLRAWLQRLQLSRAQAEHLVGTNKVDIYEKYLKLAWIGFHTGSMDLARMGMRRIEAPSRDGVSPA